MLPLFPIIAGLIGGGAVAVANRSKYAKGGATHKGVEIYQLGNGMWTGRGIVWAFPSKEGVYAYINEGINSGRAAVNEKNNALYFTERNLRKMDKGGAIIAKEYPVSSAEELWKAWSHYQRGHFLLDHKEEIKDTDRGYIYPQKGMEFEQLTEHTQRAVKDHYRGVRYALGGVILGTLAGGYLGYKIGKSQEKSDDVFRKEKELINRLRKKASSGDKTSDKKKTKRWNVTVSASDADGGTIRSSRDFSTKKEAEEFFNSVSKAKKMDSKEFILGDDDLINGIIHRIEETGKYTTEKELNDAVEKEVKKEIAKNKGKKFDVFFVQLIDNTTNKRVKEKSIK